MTAPSLLLAALLSGNKFDLIMNLTMIFKSKFNIVDKMSVTLSQFKISVEYYFDLTVP